jgi:hypothetical protein
VFWDVNEKLVQTFLLCRTKELGNWIFLVLGLVEDKCSYLEDQKTLAFYGGQSQSYLITTCSYDPLDDPGSY